MRIIVVGGTGTLGREVVDLLDSENEVVVASRTSEARVDLEDPGSIAALYDRVGDFDAVICAAGSAKFGPLSKLTDADFDLGLRSKLMGQVNLVRLGLPRIRDKGSFTLTSGVLAQRPMPGSSAIALVNGALESFARAAALEMPRGVRVNVVSPGWVKETLAAMGLDPTPGTEALDVAQAYVEALEGRMNGEVLRP